MIWEELHEDLIFCGLELKDTDELFSTMGSTLHELGYVKDSYSLALKKREKDYPTGLNIGAWGVAIPHTEATHVIRPAIAIATLTDPIEFIEMGTEDAKVQAKIIFMLAISEPHAHLEQLQAIISIIQDSELLEAVYNSHNAQDIIALIKAKETVGARA